MSSLSQSQAQAQAHAQAQAQQQQEAERQAQQQAQLASPSQRWFSQRRLRLGVDGLAEGGSMMGGYGFGYDFMYSSTSSLPSDNDLAASPAATGDAPVGAVVQEGTAAVVAAEPAATEAAPAATDAATAVDPAAASAAVGPMEEGGDGYGRPHGGRAGGEVEDDGHGFGSVSPLRGGSRQTNSSDSGWAGMAGAGQERAEADLLTAAIEAAAAEAEAEALARAKASASSGPAANGAGDVGPGGMHAKVEAPIQPGPAGSGRSQLPPQRADEQGEAEVLAASFGEQLSSSSPDSPVGVARGGRRTGSPPPALVLMATMATAPAPVIPSGPPGPSGLSGAASVGSPPLTATSSGYAEAALMSARVSAADSAGADGAARHGYGEDHGGAGAGEGQWHVNEEAVNGGGHMHPHPPPHAHAGHGHGHGHHRSHHHHHHHRERRRTVDEEEDATQPSPLQPQPVDGAGQLADQRQEDHQTIEVHTTAVPPSTEPLDAAADYGFEPASDPSRHAQGQAEARGGSSAGISEHDGDGRSSIGGGFAGSNGTAAAIGSRYNLAEHEAMLTAVAMSLGGMGGGLGGGLFGMGGAGGSGSLLGGRDSADYGSSYGGGAGSGSGGAAVAAYMAAATAAAMTSAYRSGGGASASSGGSGRMSPGGGSSVAAGESDLQELRERLSQLERLFGGGAGAGANDGRGTGAVGRAVGMPGSPGAVGTAAAAAAGTPPFATPTQHLAGPPGSAAATPGSGIWGTYMAAAAAGGSAGLAAPSPQMSATPSRRVSTATPSLPPSVRHSASQATLPAGLGSPPQYLAHQPHLPPRFGGGGGGGGPQHSGVNSLGAGPGARMPGLAAVGRSPARHSEPGPRMQVGAESSQPYFVPAFFHSTRDGGAGMWAAAAASAAHDLAVAAACGSPTSPNSAVYYSPSASTTAVPHGAGKALVAQAASPKNRRVSEPAWTAANAAANAAGPVGSVGRGSRSGHGFLSWNAGPSSGVARPPAGPPSLTPARTPSLGQMPSSRVS